MSIFKCADQNLSTLDLDGLQSENERQVVDRRALAIGEAEEDVGLHLG